MIKLWNSGNGKRILAFVLCMALALETADIRALAVGNAELEEVTEETHPGEEESVSGNDLADAFPGTVDGMEYDETASNVQAVYADGLIASGEQYGIKWSIDADGVLMLSGDAEQISEYDAYLNRPAWLEYNTSITAAIVTAKNVEYTYDWFASCSNLKVVDLRQFNTDSVKVMAGMFENCSSLESLDVSSFNTSNVTSMHGMFQGCSSLKSLDVSNFNTSNVIKMAAMFNRCGSLKSLDLSSFNTSNVKDMGYMFIDCSSLESLDVSSFNTSNVTDMTWIFHDCSSLKSLDLSNFNTSNVTSMMEMFQGCSSLESLDLSNFDTSNVTSMSSMFYGCSSLKSLDLSGFNTSNVKDMSWMFSGCSSLKSLDLSSFNTSNVTDMREMFYNCSSLESLDVSSFNTSNVTDMTWIFYDCSSLKSLDLSNINTSNVTSIMEMFQGCSSLESLDLSNFDTSNLTSMSSMFYGCSSLKSLDLSGFNTSNVKDMHCMFYDCSSLESLDVSIFNTSNVTDMGWMFYDCSSLESLDLSNLDTSNVTSMRAMFACCSNLKSLDISKWDTRNVTNMQFMFGQCSSLKNLDLSNMNLASLEQADGMLKKCNALKQIEAPLYLNKDISLPYEMLDGEGNVYTSLPKGLTVSITLTRKPGSSPLTPSSSGLEITLAHGNQYNYTGSAVKPEVLVTENGRTLVEGADYTVKYSNNVNASVIVNTDGSLAVGADGQYLPVNAGKQPTVTVTVKGNYSGSQTLHFAILPTDLAGLYPTGLSVKAEEGTKPDIMLLNGAARLSAKDYSLSKDGAAYLPAAVGAGETFALVATGKGNYRGNIAVTVTGVAPKSLHRLTVTPVKQFKGFEYNGMSQTPVFGGREGAADAQVVVSSKTAPKTENGGEGLKEYVDYYVSYSPDTVNTGTVKYTVVGMGDYTGSVTKTYKINPVKASSGLTVSYDRDRQYAFNPAGSTVDGIQVTFLNAGSQQATNDVLNNTVLTAGKDYKITYSNHKKAGTGKFTVNFLGNYKGSAALKNNPFTIRRTSLGELAAQGRVRVVIPDKTAKKSGVYKSAPIVTVDNVLLKSSNYTVSYYTDESLQTPMDKNGSEIQLDAEHPSAQVWVKIEGKDNYGMSADGGNPGLSDIGGQRLGYRVFYPDVRTQGELSRARISLAEKSYVYTGEEICPGKDKFNVVCKVGKESVTLDESQYDIVCLNNVNKGRATAVITGNGKGCEQNGYSFVGSKTIPFTIIARKVK